MNNWIIYLAWVGGLWCGTNIGLSESTSNRIAWAVVAVLVLFVSCLLNLKRRS
jgi:hypothetical protein